jgi:hypothetical protein
MYTTTGAKVARFTARYIYNRHHQLLTGSEEVEVIILGSDEPALTVILLNTYSGIEHHIIHGAGDANHSGAIKPLLTNHIRINTYIHTQCTCTCMGTVIFS